MNNELKNGDTIWRMTYNNIEPYTVKEVRKEGMIVSARIVCERGTMLSNLVCGHKNNKVLVGDNDIFYSDKRRAETIREIYKHYYCLSGLLYEVQNLGMDFTVTSTELLKAINKKLNKR